MTSVCESNRATGAISLTSIRQICLSLGQKRFSFVGLASVVIQLRSTNATCHSFLRVCSRAHLILEPLVGVCQILILDICALQLSRQGSYPFICFIQILHQALKAFAVCSAPQLHKAPWQTVTHTNMARGHLHSQLAAQHHPKRRADGYFLVLALELGLRDVVRPFSTVNAFAMAAVDSDQLQKPQRLSANFLSIRQPTTQQAKFCEAAFLRQVAGVRLQAGSCNKSVDLVPFAVWTIAPSE